VSSCFAALRHIRSIRRSVCQTVLLSLVTSLVLMRLDYGSVTLNGITVYLQHSAFFRINVHYTINIYDVCTIYSSLCTDIGLQYTV